MALPMLMSYDEWKEQTYAGRLSARSQLLKDVDDAIRNYHIDKSEDTLEDLKVKFGLWCQSKEDFRLSIRNTKSEAPWKLHLQLFFGQKTDTQSLRELAMMKEAQKEICMQIFRGCNMKFKSKLKTAKDFANDVKDLLEQLGFKGFSVPSMVAEIIAKVKSGVTQAVKYVSGKTTLDGIIANVVNFVLNLIKSLQITVMEFIDMLKAEIYKLLENLLMHLIPLASTAEFIVEFAPKVYALVKKQMKIRQTRIAKYFFAQGDPKAAVNSLKHALQSERNAMAVDLAADLASAATDAFAPVGSQAVKWANDFRKTLTSIIKTVQHCKEIRKVNQLFKRLYVSTFDLEIFKTSPLLACYVISTCTQSQLVSMLPGNAYSFSTWINYTKRVIEDHIKPMQEEARRLMDEHPCEVEGIGDALREDADQLREAILKHKALTKGYLGDIHRAAHLSEIRRFDKSNLQETVTKVGSGKGVLDDITWFNKSKLSQTDMHQEDHIAQMKQFEMSLKSINNQILTKTWLNEQAFNRTMIGDKVIGLSKWKKLSWVTFGRRHEFTQAIDKGLTNYSQIFQTSKSKYAVVITKSHLASCLKDITNRIEYISNKILKPLHHWLDPNNKVHQTSKRLKAMQQLRVLIDNEISQLSLLHSQYSSKKHQAQLLYG
ncbi:MULTISPECIES: hypothetical protein [unclassified Pseudoalteromonas]|uniref:hypothetical protein n=1 Tax=unclassified Pseudoalteromonas TaxID=194690 RepID=UPI0005A961C9|nr:MULTISPECIES: hypothetical protein [unclassified Pseudoalteromonas]